MYKYKFLSEDVKSELSDIGLELSDIGYHVSVTNHFIQISSKSIIDYRKISEVIERMKDYLLDEGYNTSMRKGVYLCTLISEE